MASPFVDWAAIPRSAKSKIMAVVPLPILGGQKLTLTLRMKTDFEVGIGSN